MRDFAPELKYQKGLLQPGKFHILASVNPKLFLSSYALLLQLTGVPLAIKLNNGYLLKRSVDLGQDHVRD